MALIWWLCIQIKALKQVTSYHTCRCLYRIKCRSFCWHNNRSFIYLVLSYFCNYSYHLLSEAEVVSLMCGSDHQNFAAHIFSFCAKDTYIFDELLVLLMVFLTFCRYAVIVSYPCSYVLCTYNYNWVIVFNLPILVLV